jgi:hypothetical protein
MYTALGCGCIIVHLFVFVKSVFSAIFDSGSKCTENRTENARLGRIFHFLTRKKHHNPDGCGVFGGAFGIRSVKVSLPSSRQRATVHRTVAFDHSNPIASSKNPTHKG